MVRRRMAANCPGLEEVHPKPPFDAFPMYEYEFSVEVAILWRDNRPVAKFNLVESEIGMAVARSALSA